MTSGQRNKIGENIGISAGVVEGAQNYNEQLLKGVGKLVEKLREPVATPA